LERAIAAFGSIWALDAHRLELLVAAFSLPGIEALAEARAPKSPTPSAARGNVAVIPVYGVLAQRGNLLMDACGPGASSTEVLGQAIDAALADPSVRSIVLDVDSPGGSVYGIQELADAIFAARQQKPIAAVANAQASSAAYWLASAAHEIYVTPSGEVGSIGVYGTHVDTSKADEAAGKATTVISAGKFKAEGLGPLTDEARAHLQSRIDAYYTTFVKAVAKHRGVGVDAVRSGFGEGRTVGAQAALDAGMVDGVATLADVISKYARRTPETANRSRALEARVAIAAAGVR
jgi:signal peptide peptidase SppA